MRRMIHINRFVTLCRVIHATAAFLDLKLPLLLFFGREKRRCN
jgi:hypothetical protein